MTPHFSKSGVVVRGVSGVLVGAVLLLAVGCAKRGGEIGRPAFSPQDVVQVGGKAQLSAAVSGMEEGTSYRFTPSRGQCVPYEFPMVLTTFCAPDEPGDVIIQIEALRGGKVFSTRACTIRVVASGAAPAPAGVSPAAPKTNVRPELQPTFFLGANGFLPTGFMADGEQGQRYVRFAAASTEKPFSPTTCQKWSYVKGPAGFASVAWQFPANNWGTRPGQNLSNRGFTNVSWYARSAVGGEAIEFFSGGHTDGAKPYQSSFDGLSVTITLTNEWKRYTMDLTGKDMSSVICAFGWSAKEEVTFFLDDIMFE